jgi:hypothetical protein
MLFLSTLGSFLGSVVSTLVLMTFLGVHVTVAFTLGLVVVLAGFIGWRDDKRHGLKVAVAGLGLFILAVNSPAVMRAYGIVSDNLYSQVRFTRTPLKQAGC